MKRLIIKGAITGLVFSLLLLGMGQACSDNRAKVETILAKHAEAMGGKEKWEKLQSYHKVWERPDGIEVTMTCLMPDKISIDFKGDDLSLSKVYDGAHGYLIRNGIYEPMRPGEAVEMAEEPDYYSELIFALDRNYEILHQGQEEVGGVLCEKLQVRKSPTDEQIYWLDANTYLIEQTGEYSEDKAHEGIYYRTRLTDYRDVNGYMFPFEQILIPDDGTPISSKVKELQVDVPLQQADFVFQPQTTANLIRYWKDRYQEDRLKAFTFVQETIRYQEGKVRDTLTWYEAVQYPNSFRIDLGEKAEQNRNLYRNDSVYVLREGELVHQGPQIQEFMIMEGSLFDKPVDTTLAMLSETGVDHNQFRVAEHQGRPCYVIGGAEGDETSPQMWLDQERLYTVRRFSRTRNGGTLEVKYDDFQLFDGHYVETWLEFFVDGQLIQTERYNDVNVKPKLDPLVFDPEGFKQTFWY